MVQIKRKVTIKTKSTQEEISSVVESGNQYTQKKSNKYIWIGGSLIIAVIVGVLIYINKENGDTIAEPINVVESPKTAEIKETTEEQGKEDAANNETESTEPTTATNLGSASNVEEAVESKDDVTSPKTNKTSQSSANSFDGSIEEKAKQVIRGDFGNGQYRKDKLGSSYSEIQSKVNEMYRNNREHF